MQQASDAGSGDLRAAHLQDAEREIAKLDPARHGRMTNQLQSAALALQGRGGDTQVAHVTPGEIVIPLSVLTPRLRQALAAAVRSAGIDPRSLVVGNDRNSVNPRTGQPEFAFGDTDQDAEKPRWAPSDRVGEVVPTDWTSGVIDKMWPGSFFDELKRWNKR